ncbi:MAG: glucosyltransferase domain-containing protein [Pseudomonadota bacterium]
MIKFNKITNFDISSYAANKRNSSVLFLSLVALNVFAFFIFVAHHPLHNHALRMPWINPLDQVHHGRWFNFFLMKLTGAADIPVFLPLFAIVLNVISGILLLRILDLKLSKLESFIVVGLITTFPMFLSLFYFTWSTPLTVIGGMFAVLSVFCTKKLSFFSVLSGSFFFLLMMASYQVGISIFAAVAVMSIISALYANARFTDILYSGVARFLSAVFGGLLYLFSIELTGASSHATETIGLEQLPARIVQVAEISFQHLIVTQPDLLNFQKELGLALLAIGVLLSLLVRPVSPARMVLVLASWLVLIVSTKAMYLVSSNNVFFEYRYNTSLAFLLGFTAAIALHCSQLKIVRSTVIVLSLLLLTKNVQADLIRQEVLMRGQQHDLALANRILARIESLSQLDTTKTYDLVRVGSYSSFRHSIMSAQGHGWDKPGDTHMDKGDITDTWADEDVFILLGSKVRFKHRGFDPQFKKKIQDARAELLNDRKPWPHKSSVFIHEDKIIVYMN